MPKKIDHFVRNNDFIKIINNIVTNDSDYSYLPKKYQKISKKVSFLYLLIIFLIVIATFWPLFIPIENQSSAFTSPGYILINLLAFLIFLIDYLGRWISFPFRRESKNITKDLLIFPFTGVSIILLLSMIPSLLSSFFFLVGEESDFITTVNVLILFRIGRLVLLLNVLPAFKIFSKIISERKSILINIFVFTIGSFVLFALIIYHVEGPANPKINDYWDAFYFTIVCVTTIGFGDIVPVTTLGQAVVIVLSILGVIIFAIPSGVIAGSFISELAKTPPHARKSRKNTNKEINKDDQIPPTE